MGNNPICSVSLGQVQSTIHAEFHGVKMILSYGEIIEYENVQENINVILVFPWYMYLKALFHLLILKYVMHIVACS